MLRQCDLQPGQRVEVLFERHGWLPGTFDFYVPGLSGEDFRRCWVTMDNRWVCIAPGFHPDCVRAMEDVTCA